MKADPIPSARRGYDSSARDRATQERKERCIALFAEKLATDWYRDITLEWIAEEAGITVPTLLRYFGSKEGLLEQATAWQAAMHVTMRTAPSGDISANIAGIVESYEQLGDYSLRMLAQEERFEVIRIYTDTGRQGHRQLVETGFAPFLANLGPDERTHMLDELVTALDLYVWKVLRRDRGRSAADVCDFMEMAVNAIIARRSRPAFDQGD